MRSAHTVEQVREAEAALMATLPEGTLMDRAATGLAHAVAELLGRAYGARVHLLVGSGANGGDALFAGAHLARWGAHVDAQLLSPDQTHEAGLRAFRAAGGRVVDGVGRLRPDVAVDGIIGIGGRGGLRPDAAAAVAALAGVPIVAVDVPSGVDVDTGRVDGPHVEATVTVTFGTHKVAHLVDPAARASGAVHLVDIGLDLAGLGPADVTALQADDVARLLPVPEPTAHKYTRGVVGVRAGSKQYPGAAVLCVAGASVGLAGMVRYVGDAADLVHASFPEVVVGPGQVQAWVVGSGGGDEGTRALGEVVADGGPVVVDADGLTGVRGVLDVPALLTPHAGELARMLDVDRAAVEADQLGHARHAAQTFGSVVLLKGRHTLVAAPDGRVRVTTVGPPWLATAGAGDVLAGLCGALLAAGLDPFDAGSVGSWLHGSAAALASDHGPLRASAVAAALPEACRVLLR
jgi:ADP-dependent NAD(P)H-hydrate dehydratase / NAD(P)H-hydrate epimerase